MSELVITGYGISVGSRRGYIHLRTHNGETTLIPPSNLQGVLIASKNVTITVNALITLSRYGVEVTVLHKGKPACKITPMVRGATLKTKLAQLEVLNTPKRLEISKRFVEGKLHNQKTVLRSRIKTVRDPRLVSELDDVVCRIAEDEEKIPECSSVDEVRAYEAHAAKAYWYGVSLLLPRELSFQGRDVNNPVDSFNQCLNIGYGVLRSRTWSALLLVGLDPYIGYLHYPRGRHLCLASDLMEEFRPVAVDRPLTAQAINNPSSLNGENKLITVIKIVSSELKRNGNELGNAIITQARRLAAYIVGASEDYLPYKIRW